jgi:threonine/homoserine/homoserine lactone efflux protein
MTPETLAALAAFALVTSVTPGPNNMMLLASGANFGFRRTVPHMLGISLGHAVMVAGVGLGIMALFERFPLAHRLLTVASVACMLWLAWKIANAAPPAPGKPGGRPFSFLQAAAFQWVNPKAWAMAMGAITLYAPARDAAAIAVVAGVFAAVNLPSVGLWAAAGQGLRGWLAAPARLRAFNWTMAALLVASLALLL